MTNQTNPSSSPEQPQANDWDAIAAQFTQIFEKTFESATETGEAAAKAGQQWLEQTTAETGKNLAGIAENSFFRSFIDFFKAQWLLTLLGEVDTEQVRKRVSELQQKYPQERPAQISHRLIVDQAIKAGGIGFATNLIPPIAIALFGIDLVAVARLQAEMVYEIAAAYGFDLNDPARRGEALLIYGVSISSSVFKTGFGFIEIIPGVGAVIGASTNAVLLYTLGYIAARFYEAKLTSPNASVSPQALWQEMEEYQQSAITQRRIMDRVLVKMLQVSYPNQSQSEILAQLQAANLAPGSVEEIVEFLEHPQSLETLLDQLDPELAPALLARCSHIAQLDNVITFEEAKVLNAIARKFQLDLDAVKNSVTPSQSV